MLVFGTSDDCAGTGHPLVGRRRLPERRAAIFGNSSWENPPISSASRPEWHGRSIGEFEVDDRPLEGALLEDFRRSNDVGESEFVPCLVRGYLDSQGLLGPFADLLVVVNGIVFDSATPANVDMENTTLNSCCRNPRQLNRPAASKSSAWNRILRTNRG